MYSHGSWLMRDSNLYKLVTLVGRPSNSCEHVTWQQHAELPVLLVMAIIAPCPVTPGSHKGSGGGGNRGSWPAACMLG